jgi:hypothetical protein
MKKAVMRQKLPAHLYRRAAIPLQKQRDAHCPSLSETNRIRKAKEILMLNLSHVTY